MKRIAILMYSMDCGGIEKAALSIMRALPPEYEVHLVLEKKSGAFLKYVPENIIIDEIKFSEESRLRRELGDRKWVLYSLIHGKLRSFIQTLYFIGYKFFCPKEKARLKKVEQLSKGYKFPQTEFDYVLAYSNIEQLYYGVNILKSKQVFTWCHCEIDLDREDFRYYADLYSKCNRIFGVAEKTTDSFKKCFPNLSHKTSTYLNLIDETLAKNLADTYQIKRPNKLWHFLTVGRFTMQKGIDVIPDIALKLKDQGVDFVWSIIGDGPLRDILMDKTKEYSLESEINFLGEQDNPYPYFKECDVYLQPSRYEGYCITVAEARMFHKPIIATDFAGASEQLENGKCGKIVKFGIESFAHGVMEVVNNPQLRERFVKNLSKQKIDTTDTIYVLTGYFSEI